MPDYNLTKYEKGVCCTGTKLFFNCLTTLKRLNNDIKVLKPALNESVTPLLHSWWIHLNWKFLNYVKTYVKHFSAQHIWWLPLVLYVCSWWCW